MHNGDNQKNKKVKEREKAGRGTKEGKRKTKKNTRDNKG